MSGSGTSSASRFLHWWRASLADAFSRDDDRGPAVRTDAVLLKIGQDEDEIWLRRAGSEKLVGRFAADETHAAAVACAGRTVGRTGRIDVGLSLPLSRCLVRSGSVPRNARADTHRIMLLDLESSTPFRAGDVYTATQPDRSSSPASGQCAVTQIVAKRNSFKSAASALAAQGMTPAFIETWDDIDANRPPVVLHDAKHSDAAQRPRSRLSQMAALLAIALAGAAAYTWFDRQDAEIARLTAQADSAQARLAAMRRTEQDEQLAATRAAAVARSFDDGRRRVASLATLTRLLPETVWLTDLDIDGDAVSISGYAPAAAALVALIDTDPNFADTHLTAPVMFEAGEQKERFSLRFSIRPQDAPPKREARERATGATALGRHSTERR